MVDFIAERVTGGRCSDGGHHSIVSRDGRRFADDRDRVAFDRALAAHTWQASGIVAEFAAGWYGKTVWQGDGPTPEKISNFSSYAFK